LPIHKTHACLAKESHKKGPGGNVEQAHMGYTWLHRGKCIEQAHMGYIPGYIGGNV